MDTLKKAGAMLQHLDLFHHMLDLRGLLQLAAHMEERGDRVTLISPEQITLMGTDTTAEPKVSTSKGATIEAATAYRVLQTLKGYEASEYAVNREELSALNAKAVAELESSDALRAFGETLNRVSAAAAVSGSAASVTAPAAEVPSERANRQRRAAEETPAEAAATPAA